MALIIADGFEQYSAGAADFIKQGWGLTGSVTLTSGTDRNGLSRYIMQTGSSSAAYFTYSFAEASTVIVGMALYRGNPTSDGDVSGLIDFYYNNERQCNIGFGMPGVPLLYNGSTFLASADEAILYNTWTFIEIKIVFGNGTGSCIIKQNGKIIMNKDSLDNCGAASATTCNNIRFGHTDVAPWTYGATILFDDIYICNGDGSFCNDFLGDCRIHYLLPTADTADADWTCGTGSDHYALVDDSVHNDDTGSDYLYTSTNGHKDIYDLGNLPSDIYKVRAVIAETWARLESAGDSTIKHVIVSGATENAGTGKGLTTGYLPQRTIWESDPNENPAAAWTPTTVNAAKIGVEAVIA